MGANSVNNGYCARRSDVRLDSGTYRTRVALNVQDMKRYTGYFFLTQNDRSSTKLEDQIGYTFVPFKSKAQKREEGGLCTGQILTHQDHDKCVGPDAHHSSFDDD